MQKKGRTIRKTLSVIVFTLVFSTTAWPASKKKTACSDLLSRSVTKDWVQKMIRQNAEIDPQQKRLRDSVQTYGFEKAAYNRDIKAKHTSKYTHELPVGSVTDQQNVGNCWILAGLNMIRSSLMTSGKAPEDFRFSSNYIFFFSLIEDSNRYFEKLISAALPKPKSRHEKASEGFFDELQDLMTPSSSQEELEAAAKPNVDDGGTFNHLLFLVEKYGLVPYPAMRDTISSLESETVLTELNMQLARSGQNIIKRMHELEKQKISHKQKLEKLREQKASAMAEVWNVLATHLGSPPDRVEWRTDGKARKTKPGKATVTPAKIKRYTPQEFAKEFANFDSGDYVALYASPQLKVNQVLEVEDSTLGISHSKAKAFPKRILVTDSETMMNLSMASIENGMPVWTALDIKKDTDKETGIMHPGIFQREVIYQSAGAETPQPLAKEFRIYFGVTGAIHAMALTGFDRPDRSKPVIKFKAENSWGEDSGDKGVYHLYREWFEEHVFEVIVHKKFLSKAQLKLWEKPAAATIGQGDL